MMLLVPAAAFLASYGAMEVARHRLPNGKQRIPGWLPAVVALGIGVAAQCWPADPSTVTDAEIHAAVVQARAVEQIVHQDGGIKGVPAQVPQTPEQLIAVPQPAEPQTSEAPKHPVLAAIAARHPMLSALAGSAKQIAVEKGLEKACEKLEHDPDAADRWLAQGDRDRYLAACQALHR